MRTQIPMTACLLSVFLTGCGSAPRSQLARAVHPQLTDPLNRAAAPIDLELPDPRAELTTEVGLAGMTPDALPSTVAPMTAAATDADGTIQVGLRSLFHVEEPPRPGEIRLAGFDALPESDPSDEPLPAEPLDANLIAPDDAPVASVTLADLESMAATNNPTLQSATAIVQKAVGVQRQVGRPANPTVNYMGEEMGDDHTWGMQGAFLTQTFVLGDKLAWNERVAAGDVQAMRWQAETQRYRVRNDVRRAFFITLGAQEKVKLAEELEQIAEDGVKNAQALVNALQAAPPDLLQAEIQLNEVQILLRNAEFEHQAAWRQLANLVGLPSLAMANIDHPLDQDLPERDAETLRQQLLSGSPQLQQARAEASRARTLIGREQAQVIPNLNLQVGGMYMSVADNTAANLQLGVPLPIFNRNDGNIDRAAAEYRRATWNVQRLELQLQSGFASAWSDYQQSHNRVRTSRDEILPREQRTLELIEIGYPIQFDFLRVLTARRSYFEARIDYLEALVDLRQAEVILDGLLLTGGLDAVPDTNADDGLRGRALSGQ